MLNEIIIIIIIIIYRGNVPGSTKSRNYRNGHFKNSTDTADSIKVNLNNVYHGK